MLKVYLSRAASFGLVKRQPIEVSTISPGLANAFSGLASTQGARVIDSTPPAMTTSASPDLTMLAARCTAESPDAQSRLTVMPGNGDGQPGEQAGHAGDVAVVFAGLVGGAENDLVDRGRVDAGARDEFSDDQRGQIVGAHLRERSPVSADRGADAADYKCFRHGSITLLGTVV